MKDSYSIIKGMFEVLITMINYEYMKTIYKSTTVNRKIISINKFLRYIGYKDYVLKFEKIQKQNGIENVLSEHDYFKLYKYACIRDYKYSVIIATLANSGIRVGELKYNILLL